MTVETFASKNPTYSSWRNWRPPPLELWGGWHGPGFWQSDQQAVVSSSCCARSARPGSFIDVASLFVALMNPLHLLFKHIEDVCNFSRRLGLESLDDQLWFLVWSWACWQKQCWALTDDLKFQISAFIAQSHLQLSRGGPSGLRRWFANAMHRGTGARIPPLPRAEFGRLTLEWHNWLVTGREGGRKDSAT